MVIVVGGISMLGGIGSVGGILFGAVSVGMMNNMIILLGLNTDYAEFMQGVVIILAVALNIYTNRKSQNTFKPDVPLSFNSFSSINQSFYENIASITLGLELHFNEVFYSAFNTNRSCRDLGFAF